MFVRIGVRQERRDIRVSECELPAEISAMLVELGRVGRVTSAEVVVAALMVVLNNVPTDRSFDAVIEWIESRFVAR